MNKPTKNKKIKRKLTPQEEERRKLQARKGFLSLYNHWVRMGKPSI